MNWKVINGNNIDILKEYPDNHFDSIVTDPPYGIAFLGKDWDNNTGAMETWEECFRVLKPGGHILAFSAARTYHHLATNVEMAGFEIRDQLMWLYGSGFPKAQDIGKAIDKRKNKREGNTNYSSMISRDHNKCKQCGKTNVQLGIGFNCRVDDCRLKELLKPADNEWSGWKTALKPAHEPIVMARKPFSGSAIDNVLEHGVGALNIDASRIPWSGETPVLSKRGGYHNTTEMSDAMTSALKPEQVPQASEQGRFPSNVIMDEEAGAILDEQAPRVGNASSSKRTKTGMTGTGASLQWHKNAGESNGISDGLSGASKFFYCPKVSRKERHTNGEAENNHPTVKPVELMKYLVKLVTPEGGRVLDPFNGSGSTGMACVELGYDYTGCELDPDYVEIANNRIGAWYEHTRPDTNYDDLFEERLLNE